MNISFEWSTFVVVCMGYIFEMRHSHRLSARLGCSSNIQIVYNTDLNILDQRGLMQRVLPTSMGGIIPHDIIIQRIKNLDPLPRESIAGSPRLRGAMINYDYLGASLMKNTSQLIFGNLSHEKFDPNGVSEYT